MKLNHAAICIYMLLQATVVSADAPLFTEDDLERYRSRSGRPAAAEQQSAPAMQRDALSAAPAAAGKRFEVPYRAFEGGARRIILQVTLNRSVTVPMALDTGSPGMIISERLAERLGIFSSDEGRLLVTAGGIGGTVPAVLTIIDTVQSGGAGDRFVPTLITHSLSDAFDGLVGMDFLANYSINVDTGRRVVVFEELPPKKEMPAGHDEMWWRSQFKTFARMRDEWKGYRQAVEKANVDQPTRVRLRGFADRQLREADKLFNKLNGYAIEHSVPMHWRAF